MRERLRRAVPSMRVGRLGRTTLLSTTGMGVRALLQAAYLILLSRWLGTEGYGLFAGSVAAVVLLAPLANWGMGQAFTEQHARAPGVAAALWRSASRFSAASGLVCALLVAGIAIFAMPVRVPALDLLLLALAEMLLVPWTVSATQALLALERGRLAAMAICAVPAGRVLGAVLIIASGTVPSVNLIALTHVLGSIAGALVVMAWTARAVRDASAPAQASPTNARAWWREGLPYAFAALASNAYFEVDKLLVLQFVDAHASGVYTAAFRVVAMLLLPILGLLASALPRAFAAAHAHGLQGMIASVAGAAVGYALVAACVAWIAAPWVPRLFGPGYEATASIVAWLAAWLPLFALHHCGALALVADGAKRLRLAIDGGGLAAVVVLDVAWLPRYGVGGAVAALLVVEAAMAIACWSVFALRRTRAAR